MLPTIITSPVVSSFSPRLQLLIIVVFARLIEQSVADGNQTVVHSVIGQRVRLRCSLPHSNPPRLEWFDFVYNTDKQPIKIFTALRGKETLNSDHPNRPFYDVDANFTLIIRDVKLDDVGSYSCKSARNNITLVKSYYLAVAGHPKCNGNSTLLVGQSGQYTCEIDFSGNFPPKIEWRRDSDTVLPSTENFDAGLARKIYDLQASEVDDGTTFTCRMTFGNIIKECHVNVTVLYPVRELVIDPQKDSFAYYEEIRCSADGNPTPDISFQPPLTPSKAGVGWRSVTISKSLEGQKMEVQCIASNVFEGQKRTIQKAINFTVTSAEEEEEDKANQVQSKSASSSWAVVGGIVVGIMILVIIVAAVFCLRLRKEKTPKKEENGGTKATSTSSDETQMQVKEEQV